MWHLFDRGHDIADLFKRPQFLRYRLHLGQGYHAEQFIPVDDREFA